MLASFLVDDLLQLIHLQREGSVSPHKHSPFTPHMPCFSGKIEFKKEFLSTQVKITFSDSKDDGKLLKRR